MYSVYMRMRDEHTIHIALKSAQYDFTGVSNFDKDSISTWIRRNSTRTQYRRCSVKFRQGHYIDIGIRRLSTRKIKENFSTWGFVEFRQGHYIDIEFPQRTHCRTTI